jgi:hypothetical protein
VLESASLAAHLTAVRATPRVITVCIVLLGPVAGVVIASIGLLFSVAGVVTTVTLYRPIGFQYQSNVTVACAADGADPSEKQRNKAHRDKPP